jgi:L-asparaginase II
MPAQAYEPIYALSRGSHPESLHYGAIAVVDATGQLLAAYGDPQLSAFLRSAGKPFQALPLALEGGVEHYDISPQELAVICASHSGTDEQVAVIAGLQAKVGVTESQLMCGAHAAFHPETAARMQSAGIAPTPNRNNCSGKHTGMLATAKLRGWPLQNYVDLAHPLQQEILALFAEIASLPIEDLAIGVDGCSAPNWPAPLYNTALAYARLMDPVGLPAEQRRACTQVRDAMLAHPEMVGGPQRFDTLLMQTAGGRILAKGGAEGLQALALRPGVLAPGSPAIGIALKIADGDARGWVSHAVTLEVLRQLGVLSHEELNRLAEFGPARNITNWRGLSVGEGHPVFDLAGS